MSTEQRRMTGSDLGALFGGKRKKKPKSVPGRKKKSVEIIDEVNAAPLESIEEVKAAPLESIEELKVASIPSTDPLASTSQPALEAITKEPKKKAPKKAKPIVEVAPVVIEAAPVVEAAPVAVAPVIEVAPVVEAVISQPAESLEMIAAVAVEEVPQEVATPIDGPMNLSAVQVAIMETPVMEPVILSQVAPEPVVIPESVAEEVVLAPESSIEMFVEIPQAPAVAPISEVPHVAPQASILQATVVAAPHVQSVVQELAPQPSISQQDTQTPMNQNAQQQPVVAFIENVQEAPQVPLHGTPLMHHPMQAPVTPAPQMQPHPTPAPVSMQAPLTPAPSIPMNGMNGHTNGMYAPMNGTQQVPNHGMHASMNGTSFHGNHAQGHIPTNGMNGHTHGMNGVNGVHAPVNGTQNGYPMGQGGQPMSQQQHEGHSSQASMEAPIQDASHLGMLTEQMHQFANNQQQKWQDAQERKYVLARKRQFGFLAPSALLNLMESVAVLWRQETEERMTSKEMFIEGGLMMVETRLQALRSYGLPEEQLQALERKMQQLKNVL